MAPIVCDQCGEPFDTRISACPDCGWKPGFSRRRLNGSFFIGLAIVAVAIYLLVIGALFAQGVLLVR